MKEKPLKKAIGLGTEIAVMLALVLLFFALLTTLLFKVFPSGITLSQLIERRNSGRFTSERRGAVSIVGLQGERTRQQPAATLSQTVNDVKSRGSSSIAWGPAQEGMPLYDHDAVQTLGLSSAQIKFDRNNYMKIGGNSLVIIKNKEKESVHSERRLALVVVDGELEGRIASKRLNVAVSTPAATVSASGAGRGDSDFRISVNPDHSSTVVVFNGTASVSAGGKTVRVGADSGVTVRPGEAPSAVRPLPAAPVLKFPLEGPQVPYRDLPPRVRFLWSPGQEGDLYHLQVARDKAFKDLLVDRRVTDASFTHGNLKNGTYFWRVSRVAEGVEGRMSRAMRFDTAQNLASPPLKVNFPAGAVLEDHFVLIGSTTPGTSILVGGSPVATDARGGFSCEVPLRGGMNLVTVEAVDASGNVALKSRYIHGRF